MNSNQFQATTPLPQAPTIDYASNHSREGENTLSGLHRTGSTTRKKTGNLKTLFRNGGNKNQKHNDVHAVPQHQQQQQQQQLQQQPSQFLHPNNNTNLGVEYMNNNSIFFCNTTSSSDSSSTNTHPSSNATTPQTSWVQQQKHPAQREQEDNTFANELQALRLMNTKTNKRLSMVVGNPPNNTSTPSVGITQPSQLGYSTTTTPVVRGAQTHLSPRNNPPHNNNNNNRFCGRNGMGNNNNNNNITQQTNNYIPPKIHTIPPPNNNTVDSYSTGNPNTKVDAIVSPRSCGDNDQGIPASSQAKLAPTLSKIREIYDVLIDTSKSINSWVLTSTVTLDSLQGQLRDVRKDMSVSSTKDIPEIQKRLETLEHVVKELIIVIRTNSETSKENSGLLDGIQTFQSQIKSELSALAIKVDTTVNVIHEKSMITSSTTTHHSSLVTTGSPKGVLGGIGGSGGSGECNHSRYSIEEQLSTLTKSTGKYIEICEKISNEVKILSSEMKLLKEKENETNVLIKAIQRQNENILTQQAVTAKQNESILKLLLEMKESSETSNKETLKTMKKNTTALFEATKRAGDRVGALMEPLKGISSNFEILVDDLVGRGLIPDEEEEEEEDEDEEEEDGN